VQDFRNLKIWQKSHELTRAVCQASRGFPSAEAYGLTSQIRRAATSISANIAKGCGRGSDADFGRFVQMAMGSASEVQYLLLLARDLSYLGNGNYSTIEAMTVEVKKMLAAFLKRIDSDRKAAARRTGTKRLADS